MLDFTDIFIFASYYEIFLIFRENSVTKCLVSNKFNTFTDLMTEHTIFKILIYIKPKLYPKLAGSPNVVHSAPHQ